MDNASVFFYFEITFALLSFELHGYLNFKTNTATVLNNKMIKKLVKLLFMMMVVVITPMTMTKYL